MKREESSSADGAHRSAPDRGAPDVALLALVRPPGWMNPTPRGRYHFVVIGAGPAGIVAARAAASLGARVALIERRWLGGESLYYGSVPSATFLRTARFYAEMRAAEQYGATRPIDPAVDFDAATRRAMRVRNRIGRQNSAERLQALGVDVFFGQARFTGPETIDVDGCELCFKKALIATGSRPRSIAIPGLAEAGYLQPSTAFDLSTLPQSVLVIGGGANGCETAQMLARVGVTTVIAMSEPLFLPGEERDAAAMVSDALAKDGVQIHLNTTATQVRIKDGMKLVDLVNDGTAWTVSVHDIAVGLGREAAIDGLDLGCAGVESRDPNGVVVDDHLRTTNPRIYAAGDVCSEAKRTSIAYASGRIAAFNALIFRRWRFSDMTIPWCTFTDPEIAHVGLYVRQARERNIPVKSFTVPMHEVDSAIIDGEELGFVKIHVRDGSDRILGATIVSRQAGSMINEMSLAIVARVGMRTLEKVLRAYPTQGEAIRMAADRYMLGRVTPWWHQFLRLWLRLH